MLRKASKRDVTVLVRTAAPCRVSRVHRISSVLRVTMVSSVSHRCLLLSDDRAARIRQ